MLDLLEQFREFCKTKHPAQTYNYQDGDACAVAQFAKTIALGSEYCTSIPPEKLLDPSYEYPFVEAEIYAATKPHTFGALADRIRYRIHSCNDGIFA
jgi:hypothetical protein